MIKYFPILLCLVCVSCLTTFAQVTPTPSDSATAEEIGLKSIKFNGYYRLFLYGRNFSEPYPNLEPFAKAYGVGDVYREPMLSFWVNGRPNGRTTFSTEFFFFTPYLGINAPGNPTPVGNTFSMNLGLNLYGSFRTDHGTFTVSAGGIRWYTLSPLTMGVYQIIDRYSIFDRTPWEPVNNTDRYDDYYNAGAINRDTRWGNRAFQGFVLEGRKLPLGLNFAAFYGKTDNNAGLGILTLGGQTLPAPNDPLATIQNQGIAGNVPTYIGFNGTTRVLPNLAAGGKLEKTFNGNRIAFNTLTSWTRIDSLSDKRNSFQIHTLGYRFDVKDVILEGEIGIGAFESPVIPTNWGEAIDLRFKIPKKYTFLPFDIQLYQFSKDYFNPNGEVQTFSNPDIQSVLVGAQVQSGQASVGGALTQVNQLAHNRRGVNINTEVDLGKLKVNIGWGVAVELDTVTAELSYVHRINGLAVSRVYNPFPENATGPTVAGPYNRLFTFFRGAYERVLTTDLDPATGLPTTAKTFTAVDVQAKFKHTINKRPFFFFYLGSFGSVHSEFSGIPTLSENAYLFAQYHEFDLYYELFDKFVFTGYFGVENIRGGRFTEWDLETQLPRDQIGTGIGIGADWTISENAAIFVRQRWMNFKDRSFALDRYKGNETTIELKIYF